MSSSIISHMKGEVEEMKQRISIIIHSIAGIIIGYFSVGLNSALYAFSLMIAVLLVIGYVSEYIVEKKGMKWWFSNGGILYILFWLVTWVLFYNYSVGPVIV